MRNLRIKTAAVISLLALFAFSGAAHAASEDDTVVNYGYDESSQFFMWNVTFLEWIEAAETGTSPATIDDQVDTCGLDPDGEGTDHEYTAVTGDDGTFEMTLSDESGEIEIAECGELAGAFVTGPNGQVNHGMFLKTFNETYQGPHRGCIVRHIARSDLGKGEQQVNVDPDAEYGDTGDEPLNSAEGTATFNTAVDACLHGPNGEDPENEDSEELEPQGNERRGPPDHVLDKFDGHPGKAKGNSGNAPGNNRP